MQKKGSKSTIHLAAKLKVYGFVTFYYILCILYVTIYVCFRKNYLNYAQLFVNIVFMYDFTSVSPSF